ncbi:MAG: hypothetical protein INQ03_06405 [Candidatus Heimdallarchaeota archaeon]|nr:hypothetical protein [Candidatus Heimdallarchaeota archaeon]
MVFDHIHKEFKGVLIIIIILSINFLITNNKLVLKFGILVVILFSLIKVAISIEINFKQGLSFKPMILAWKNQISIENHFSDYELNDLINYCSQSSITIIFNSIINDGHSNHVITFEKQSRLIPPDMNVILEEVALLLEKRLTELPIYLMKDMRKTMYIKWESYIPSIKSIISKIEIFSGHTQLQLIMCPYHLNSFQSMQKFVMKTQNYTSFTHLLNDTTPYKKVHYYGSKLDSKTNKILSLLQSKSLNNKFLYNYILDQLNSSSDKIDENESVSRIKQTLETSALNVSGFNCSILIKSNESKKLASNIKGLLLNLSTKKTSYLLDIKDIWKLYKKTSSFQSRESVEYNEKIHPSIDKSYSFSSLLHNKMQINDFSEGGIIVGGIGTGKTTLRLHIMKYLLDNNIRVIDFDIKGDAPKYSYFASKGKVLVLGKNYTINPFACPSNYTKTEYADLISRSLIELQPEGDLTPPQKTIIRKSCELTIQNEGNSRHFFENILMLSYLDREIIDNNQETTSHAVLTRFDWMKSILKSIFWTETSSLSEDDYENKSLFFDLSYISILASHHQLRFIIDLICTKIMGVFRNNAESKLHTTIFLDESQILLPRNTGNTLTRLEEIVSTLRYKGISVIATGISADLISSILLDTSFIAQYRSESIALQRALAIDNKIDSHEIPKLLPYNAIMKIKSLGSLPRRISTEEFKGVKGLSSEMVQNSDDRYLMPFNLNKHELLLATIRSCFHPHIVLTHSAINQLQIDICNFVNIISNSIHVENRQYTLIPNIIYNKFKLFTEKRVLDNTILSDPFQFLLLVYEQVLIRNISQFINHYDHTKFFKQRFEIINSQLRIFLDLTSHLVPMIYENSISKIEMIMNRLSTGEYYSYQDLIFAVEYLFENLPRQFHFMIFNQNDSSHLTLEEYIGLAFDLNLICQNQYLDLQKFMSWKINTKPSLNELSLIGRVIKISLGLKPGLINIL